MWMHRLDVMVASGEGRLDEAHALRAASRDLAHAAVMEVVAVVAGVLAHAQAADAAVRVAPHAAVGATRVPQKGRVRSTALHSQPRKRFHVRLSAHQKLYVPPQLM